VKKSKAVNLPQARRAQHMLDVAIEFSQRRKRNIASSAGPLRRALSLAERESSLVGRAIAEWKKEVKS
jgi:hypothetical protein